MSDETVLRPLPQALGLDSSRCLSEVSSLIVKEKLSWSGGDFSVKNAAGEVVVTIKGSIIGSKREFTSGSGSPLFTMKKEHFHPIHPTWKLEDASGKKFLTMSKEFMTLKEKFHVTFSNALAGGEEVELLVQGSWLKRKVDVYWGDNLVAKIRKKIAIQWMGNDTYGVEVAPGADYVLMAALAVAIDECHDAQQKSGGWSSG
ncbi:MAG: hypothetical protein M1820_005250 [Bogoriella megaspora]|nr:MAG: hypothetical protein M1820_005250 [Bogoriella megaspora]